MEAACPFCYERASVNDVEGTVSYFTIKSFGPLYLRLIYFFPIFFDVKGGGMFTLAKIYEVVSK